MAKVNVIGKQRYVNDEGVVFRTLFTLEEYPPAKLTFSGEGLRIIKHSVLTEDVYELVPINVECELIYNRSGKVIDVK